MDIEALRQSKTANQQRIHELFARRKEKLIEEKQVALEWNHELKNSRQIQQSNVRAMTKAVAVSQQPGSINYNQTPPDEMEASRYTGRNQQMAKIESEIARIEADIRNAEREERLKNEKAITNSKMASFDAWFQANGRPKRKASIDEKYLSFVPEKGKALVKGAASKDNTVNFKSTPSVARSLRRGILTN